MYRDICENPGLRAFPDGRGYHNGMTLRDYFAAKAMQSLALTQEGHGPEFACEQAYAWADAMLKARRG